MIAIALNIIFTQNNGSSYLKLYEVVLIISGVFIIISVPYLYEIRNPISITTECDFVRLIEIYSARGNFWGGYVLKFQIDNKIKSFFIYNSKFEQALEQDLAMLLRRGERFKVTYLAISKVIIEIENITYPIVNEIIDGCDTSNFTKKQIREYSKQYSKYRYR